MRLLGLWENCSVLEGYSYMCGYCDKEVAPNRGYYCKEEFYREYVIGICPNCNFPTFLAHSGEEQVPPPRKGKSIDHLPEEIDKIYTEIRECYSQNAYTASVLLARKILMNVAVHLGAQEDKNFYYYVGYLDTEGYIPKNSKGWVDIIRKKGNEATHELPDITKKDAEDVLAFTEMLLRILYEFPAKI
ncbi:DUF4145 domain-containing protein [Bacillus subtilis]|uniref:DUF4145 domain-containing protein n=1 Tax=Bacillus subtilis TaxID=1423 RepID=UPI0014319C4E|nr:DUF4145 domain-containing protein [Bacillus subtilis]MCL6426390.1 DUF4145 domain-containing protein [Bacillus subtilis]MDX6157693.1 DUF4145 domain-containing protein [Bacillus subtilis]NJI51656.1 DUF4145 domain-containing protein [Bacillus subtilis]